MKGMFSPELEKLIEITLADGKLTDQEKTVLVNAAQKEGVDVQQLDVYIQYLLYQRKEKEIKLAEERKVSETIGDVKRCPHCGAVYVPGTLVCESCGYALDVTIQSNAYKKFQDEVHKKVSALDTSIGGFMKKTVLGALSGSTDTHVQSIQNYISTYPVPNNRIDLLEFILNLQGLADPKGPKEVDELEPDFSYYYWVLFTNCINKAKVYFSADKDFQASFEYHKEKSKEKRGLFSKLFG